MLKGIPVSPGYAIAKVLKFQDIQFDHSKTIIESPKIEIERYEEAIKISVKQLEELKAANTQKLDEETLHIFDAHIAIATDPEFIDQVKQMIKTESCGLTYAVTTVVDSFVRLFEHMADDYLKSRANDLLEVKDRILRNAHHLPIIDLEQINQPIILAVYELTAAQAAQINPEIVLGYMSEIGGNTSHSAIIARQIGLPAVVGISNLMNKITDGEDVILDAIDGLVINQYDENIKSTYLNRIAIYEQKKEDLKKLIGRPTILTDGTQVSIMANIGSAKDLKYLEDNVADGVGLFRTELMYLDQTTLPTEDDLFDEYKKVLTFFGDKPVTIRTLDIGGDKPLPYINFKSEYNPALGNRAIRLSFTKPELFQTQIRALLRASIYGNMQVMFPMIATIDELTHVKETMKLCAEALDKENIPYKPFKVGIMIEIPAAAIMADQFAPLVDFFSIGTNDLIQYTFAADRTNPDVDYLYQPFHPVITRLIKMVVDAANKSNINVSVCGEMAGHPIGAKLLVGLGITSLSMTPISILPIKDQLMKLSHKDLTEKARKALSASSEVDIINHFI